MEAGTRDVLLGQGTLCSLRDELWKNRNVSRTFFAWGDDLKKLEAECCAVVAVYPSLRDAQEQADLLSEAFACDIRAWLHIEPDDLVVDRQRVCCALFFMRGLPVGITIGELMAWFACSVPKDCQWFWFLEAVLDDEVINWIRQRAGFLKCVNFYCDVVRLVELECDGIDLALSLP